MECNPYFISNCTARIVTLKGINVTDIDIYLRKELGDIIVCILTVFMPNISQELFFHILVNKNSIHNIKDTLICFNIFKVHVTCFKQISNVYRIFAINVTWNLCNFFAKQGINFYQTVLMTWVAKWSNVNHACPYSVCYCFCDLTL